MRRHRIRRRSGSDPAELNITAFMNLMVILVPFLLITAVFSRITILELNLPEAAASASASKKKDLQLEVVVRNTALEIRNGSTLVKRVGTSKGGYDYRALSKYIQAIKSQYPRKTDATILAEPNTSYETLVQVMDALRSADIVQSGSLVKVDLFPDISIGDAPIRTASLGAD